MRVMKLTGAKYRLVVLALAPLAISGAVPALATNQATELSWQPLSREERTSPQRVAAIRACNARAAKIGAARDWQTATFAIYGACMLEHGQRFG